MSSLAQNLKRIRESKRPKMSQVKLAGLSGVSQQLISQIERGENNSTSPEILVALAEVLGCPVTDLYEGLSRVAFPPDETKFVDLYRNATPERKLRALAELLPKPE